MLTLYSYPQLFGVADNNGYGLKVFAVLRLCNVPFRHEHILDASSAPRGQLPFIADAGETIGDSDVIIAHLIRKYRLTIDEGLTPRQRDLDHLITRMLDDLYWVMSYSRWKDEQVLAVVPRCAARAASGPDRGGAQQGEGVQFPALSFSGHRPLPAGAGLRPRPCRSRSAGASPAAKRLSARRQSHHHRRRHLRLHRQYLFLPDRYAAEAIRGGT